MALQTSQGTREQVLQISLLEHTDAAEFMYNGALHGIGRGYLDTERSKRADSNQLLTQTITSLTASTCVAEATEIQTNLVPYPRIHLVLCGLPWIISAEKACHVQLLVAEVAASACEPDLVDVNCDLRFGEYMECCLRHHDSAVSKNVNAVGATNKA